MASGPRLLETDAALDAFVAELEGVDAYAIDTEFAREHTYFPDLALVQIAYAGGEVLIDPLRVDVRSLARVFRGPGLAVLHAASADLEIFAHRVGCVPSRIYDTQLAGAFLGHGQASLASLLRAELRLELDKGERLNDWKRRPLSDAAIAYAAGDVAHLCALREAQLARLDALGRGAWVDEESERVRTRDHGPRDPETAWWKLKGKTSLSARAQGVAQAVASLREREARARDMLPKHVLADLAVLAIAERPPRTLVELSKIRGIESSRLGTGFGARLLGAVEHGLAMPREERRAPERPDAEAPAGVATLCVAWVATRAQATKIDPALLATRDDVNEFLLDPTRGRLASGFRRELVGDALLELVRGLARVRVEDGVRLVLEPSEPA